MICPRCKNKLNKKYYKSSWTYGEDSEDHSLPCKPEDFIYMFYSGSSENSKKFEHLNNWKLIGNEYQKFFITNDGLVREYVKFKTLFDYNQKVNDPKKAYLLLNKYLENIMFE